METKEEELIRLKKELYFKKYYETHKETMKANARNVKESKKNSLPVKSEGRPRKYFSEEERIQAKKEISRRYTTKIKELIKKSKEEEELKKKKELDEYILSQK